MFKGNRPSRDPGYSSHHIASGRVSRISPSTHTLYPSRVVTEARFPLNPKIRSRGGPFRPPSPLEGKPQVGAYQATRLGILHYSFFFERPDPNNLYKGPSQACFVSGSRLGGEGGREGQLRCTEWGGAFKNKLPFFLRANRLKIARAPNDF